jgi:hypothetical protein
MYRKVTGLRTGRTDLPVIQRDAIIDAGTVAVFDFCHGWGYPEMVSPVAGGKSLQNYVRGGAPAVNGAADKTWSVNSGIRIPNGDSTQKVSLPAAMVIPANYTHFALGFFAKIDAVPTTGNGTRTAQVIGCRGATAGSQYGFNLQITSGGITNVQITLNGKNFSPAPADISYPNDGLMHHYVMEYVETGPTTMVAQLYIDGVLVYVSAGQAVTSGSFVQPDSGTLPAFGRYAPASGTVSAMGVMMARVWLQNLAMAGSKTITQMIAQDRAQNASRFS